MNDNYFLNILIPFDLLVDIDVGVIKLIERDYNDDRYFDMSRIKTEDYADLDENIFNFLLTYRNYTNPLYLITDESKLKKEDIDDLYNQLLNEEYVNILRLSKLTKIHTILNSGMIHQETPFRVTVICKNELDIQYLNEIKFKCKTILIKDNNDLSNIDLKEYDNIYVKNIEDLLYFRSMSLKVIYIANYRFNTEYVEDPNTGKHSQILKLEVIIDIINDNKIRTIDVYPFPNNINL